MRKLNKPENFNGRRYFLVVATWPYKMEQYLVLIQLSKSFFARSESSQTANAARVFLALLLSGGAA